MNLRSTTHRLFPTTTISDGAGAEGAGGAGTGAGAGEGAGAGAGEGGGEKPYWEGFASEDLRTHPSIVGKHKTPEDLARGYVNLEKSLGVPPERRIDLPADQTKAEDMRAAVWSKLGLPEKPEGYGLQLDPKATDDDKAMLAEFTAKAFEMGMPAGFARNVMAFWMDKTTAANEAYQAAMAAQKAEGDAKLHELWGAAYDRKAREVGAAIVKYGGPEMAKALDNSSFGNNAFLVAMIGKFLDAMAEPGDAGSRSGEAFRGETVMTPDQAKTEIRRIESDPELMKALRTRDHPRHKEITTRRDELARMAEGMTEKAS